MRCLSVCVSVRLSVTSRSWILYCMCTRLVCCNQFLDKIPDLHIFLQFLRRSLCLSSVTWQSAFIFPVKSCDNYGCCSYCVSWTLEWWKCTPVWTFPIDVCGWCCHWRLLLKDRQHCSICYLYLLGLCTHWVIMIVSLQYGKYDVNKNTQFMHPPFTGSLCSYESMYNLPSLCSQKRRDGNNLKNHIKLVKH